MKTLKQMINDNPFNEDDIQIIQRYFTENNLEHLGLKIIPELAASQLNKVQQAYNYARTWIPNMIDMKEVCGKKIGDKFNKIFQYCLLDLDLKNAKPLYEWAKSEIPKMKMPKVFFLPVLEYLKKYDIEFNKDENQND